MSDQSEQRPQSLYFTVPAREFMTPESVANP